MAWMDPRPMSGPYTSSSLIFAIQSKSALVYFDIFVNKHVKDWVLTFNFQKVCVIVVVEVDAPCTSEVKR